MEDPESGLNQPRVKFQPALNQVSISFESGASSGLIEVSIRLDSDLNEASSGLIEA